MTMQSSGDKAIVTEMASETIRSPDSRSSSGHFTWKPYKLAREFGPQPPKAFVASYRLILNRNGKFQCYRKQKILPKLGDWCLATSAISNSILKTIQSSSRYLNAPSSSCIFRLSIDSSHLQAISLKAFR